MTFEERKKQVKEYLGKDVTVTIDRPLGSAHPTRTEIIYPINYGYIDGVFGGDGEELDVYVLGVDEPVEEFSGKVIAIVHRKNDVEDKLVAAPDGMTFNQAEIAEKIHFQEQFYKTEIESINQKSCGAFVYRRNDNKIEFLVLLQNGSWTWSVPKGHMEAGEDERETAMREIYEEIGQRVKLTDNFKASVKYNIGDIIEKEVILFLAQTKGDVTISTYEVAEYRWASPQEAAQLLYDVYKPVIDDVAEYLKNSIA